MAEDVARAGSPTPPTLSSIGESLRTSLRSNNATSPWAALGVLLGSLVLFLAAAQATFTVRTVAILVGVLVFHELGHFIGMRAFGYRDVRMFFIPFFGAAVSGVPTGVSPLRRGIVLLLGPLPGIVLGIVITFVYRPHYTDPLGSVLSTLLFLNAINLLPLEPFDGGKLAHLIVAARYRVLDIASLIVGVVGMGYLGYRFSSWSLSVVAFFSALSLRARIRSIGVARELRKSGLPMPERVEDAVDATIESLALLAEKHVGNRHYASDAIRAKAIAAWARDIYDRARSEHPQTLPALGLGLAQFLGFAAACAALFVLVVRRPGDDSPLTEIVISDDGHVKAHLPKGFKKARAAEPTAVKVTRTVAWTPELIALSWIPKGSQSLSDIFEKVKTGLATKPTNSAVRDAEACRGGKGLAAEWNSTQDGHVLRSYFCTFEVDGGLGTYEIELEPKAYADLPVLIRIGDAGEFYFPSSNDGQPKE